MTVDKELLLCLPQRILSFFDRFPVKRIDLGRSGNAVFRIGDAYYLKLSEDIEGLTAEKNRDLWLENRLTAPQVLDYGECVSNGRKTADLAFLLTSAVKGKPLCHETYLADPDRLIFYLAEAMAIFHALPFKECPFFAERGASHTNKTVVCHGDFCLPNIHCDNGKIGFVDLGDMGKGDPWLDYAWCLWSLDYNLKTPVYRDKMLQKLGIAFDDEKYRQYIL